jgi:hypothetical protein
MQPIWYHMVLEINLSVHVISIKYNCQLEANNDCFNLGSWDPEAIFLFFGKSIL